MKRTFILLVLAAALAAGVPAAAAGEPKAAVQWRMGTLAIETIGWGKHIRERALPIVEEVTGGGLAVKIYWGGILGDDEDVIAKMEKGMLDGGGLTGQGATMLAPAMSVLELPFLFNGWEEVDVIRDAMHPTFDRLMEEAGAVFLLWLDQDFDQVHSSRYPMNRLEDFSRARWITWFGPVEAETIRSLGGDPVPMDVPEVSAAVRQGKADTAMGPAMWVLGAQLHSVVRYINPVKIRYSPSVVVVKNASYQKLEKSWRDRIRKLRPEMEADITRLIRADNQKTLDALYDYGLTHVETDPATLARMKSLTRPVWDHMAGRLYPRPLLNEITDRLEAYRKGQGR